MRFYKKFSFRAHSQENARGLIQVEECKWNEFFQDPSAWWDNRKTKSDAKEPDFVHAKSKDSLWINSFFSPSWLRKELQQIKPPPWDATRSLRASYKSYEETENSRSNDDENDDDEDDESSPRSPPDYDPFRIKQHRSLLKGCTTLDQVRNIHRELTRSKEARHPEVAKTLVAIYSKLGGMLEARDVFEKLAEPTQGSWNAMVRGFSDIGEKDLSLEFFHRMVKAGVVPDARIFVRAFKACGDIAAGETGTIGQGKVAKKEASLKKAISLHRLAEKCGQESNIFVANAVLDLYARCGGMEIARKVFERMAFQDPVSWNTMIMGYVLNGSADLALDLFSRMQDEEFVPDARTFLAAVSAVTSLAIKERPLASSSKKKLAALLDRGREIHSQLGKTRFRGDLYVANGLIEMYAKCGSMADARDVFDAIPRRSIVSWNSILSGYTQHGDGGAAIELFEEKMEEDRRRGVESSGRTFVALLGACSWLAGRDRSVALAKGRIFHGEIRGRGLGKNVFVATSLIEMYAKCGSVGEAREAFDSCVDRDVMVWNAMISGYGQHGDGRAALDLFDRMGELANSKSYAAVLAACSSMVDPCTKEEFLDKGREIHARLARRAALMEKEPSVSSALVEMYAKLGAMADARKIFDAMEARRRDASLWRSMVVGFSRAGDHTAVLGFFREMRDEGFAPDVEALVAALDAARGMEDLEAARWIQGEIAKAGLDKHKKVIEFFEKNAGFRV